MTQTTINEITKMGKLKELLEKHGVDDPMKIPESAALEFIKENVK